MVVLKGTGVFAGQDGKEQTFGPNSLLIFEPGESHHIRADKEELVYVGFSDGEPSNVGHAPGGILAKENSH